MRRFRCTPMATVTPLWGACLALAVLTGCPEDDGGGDVPDVTMSPDADVTPLPDGESCEPGAVMGCPRDPGRVAEFCAGSGDATYMQPCPGNSYCQGTQCVRLGDQQICYPGEVQGCVVEGSREALICNNSGTAFVNGICKGLDGEDSVCMNGECTDCTPTIQRCGDARTVERCEDDGSGWRVTDVCDEVGEICTGQFCEEMCARNVKFASYIGCDYWGVDLDNAFVPGGGRGYYDAQGAQFAIAVANPPDSPLAARIDVNFFEGGQVAPVPYDSDGDPLPTEPLQPGDLRVYRLPRRDVDGTVQGPLAYQIASSVPIIAYQFNPLENANVFSNDASLLLPSSLLGQEYFIMTREQTFDTLRGYLTVVAVLEGETKVSVTTTAHTEPGTIYPGTGDEREIAHMEPGETRVFTLKQFDVLNLETDRPGADLTGSRVLADKLVAAFGGSEAANAPNTARCIDQDPVTGMGVCEWDGQTACSDLMDCVAAGFNTCCADHLEQQLFPVKTWGSSYIATKSWDRGLERDIYRIMAAEDNTRLFLVPPQPGVSVPVLNRGEWFEFESASNFEIHARDDKPILVGQFLAAQDAPDPNVGGISQEGDAGTGDPAFMLAIPVEQYRHDFVVLVPEEYADNYMNVTTFAGATVAIDGEEVLPGFFDPIGSGEYSVYRQRLEPGPHVITSTEPAGVLVYGYDQYVSYAYTGGLSLNEIRNEGELDTDAPAE